MTILYKNFSGKQPFFLSILMVKRRGKENAFELYNCQAIRPNGARYDRCVSRGSLLGELGDAGDLIIEQFERDVSVRLGPLRSGSSCYGSDRPRYSRPILSSNVLDNKLPLDGRGG